jgi:hypothetical protein
MHQRGRFGTSDYHLEVRRSAIAKEEELESESDEDVNASK